MKKQTEINTLITISKQVDIISEQLKTLLSELAEEQTNCTHPNAEELKTFSSTGTKQFYCPDCEEIVEELK